MRVLPSADDLHAVTALRDKYVELLALRQAREQAQAEGLKRFSDEIALQRRAAMRALASRFPGALRELDLLNAETLARRLSRCEAELSRVDRDGPAAPFVACMIDYHRFFRQALRLKRGLSAAGDSDDAIARVLRHEALHGSLEPGWSDAELDETLLRELARPSGGRLQPLVLAAVARKHGMSIESVEQLLFGNG